MGRGRWKSTALWLLGSNQSIRLVHLLVLAWYRFCLNDRLPFLLLRRLRGRRRRGGRSLLRFCGGFGRLLPLLLYWGFLRFLSRKSLALVGRDSTRSNT
jgi:hypothetical protein